MVRLVILLIGAMVLFVTPVWAQLLEEDPPMQDNNGALSSGDNTADITQEGVEATGTKAGEITIFKTDAGVEVYSGYNKVEAIPSGSDGWVGHVTIESSSIKFQPTGRPLLDCPAEDVSNWFGPCKLVEQES